MFHKSYKYSHWCITLLQKNDSRFLKKTSGCCLVREKVLLLVQSGALGRWTPIDLFFLSECHVHVAWITQEWPHCDPSNHLLRLGYASHSAHLPIWLPTHSTCQKKRQMPLIYQLQPQPTPTSQQHFSASPHHPDHHPDTLTSFIFLLYHCCQTTS